MTVSRAIHYLTQTRSLVLVLAVAGSVVLMQPSLTQAQTTPDSSPSTTSAQPSTTTKSLKERIQRVVQENQDRVKGVMDSLGQKPRGVVGQILRITQESVTISTDKGSEIVPLSADFNITKSGKSIALESLAVEDWVTVLGYLENESFSPTRMIVSTTTLRPANYSIALGTITEVSPTGLSIQQRSNDDVLEISLTRSTRYQDLNGETVTVKDLTDQVQALIVSTESDAGKKTAQIIRILTVSAPPTPASR